MGIVTMLELLLGRVTADNSEIVPFGHRPVTGSSAFLCQGLGGSSEPPRLIAGADAAAEGLLDVSGKGS